MKQVLSVTTRSLLACSLVGFLALTARVVTAQDYPSKPIRIVTSSAGSGSDALGRLIAQGISGPLGQPVLMDYRGGGILSPEYVAKSPPDGYTLFVTGESLWITPLVRQTPYDVLRDFAPISLLVSEVQVLAVHPSLPVKSVKDLVVLAKSKPGQLNYSSIGVGASAHLAIELLKSMAGVNIVHVPYKGTSAAITALVAGEVQLTVTNASVVMPLTKADRLKALAVTTAKPSALVPGVPTVAATGVPGYEVIGVTGLWAPAKTPAAIINRLNQEVVRVLNQPDVKAKFFTAGSEVVASTPEEFAAIVKADTARMGKVIKEAGIRAD